MAEGCIFNVQRYSTHDGPGIRTTVFFKGCNLRCAWCHNPESWDYTPVIEFNRELCIGCERCVEVCPNHVHDAYGGQVAHRDRCVGCGKCAEECFAGALTLAGTRMDETRLLREIMTDLPYFRQSGGGVTFSGGECMTQMDLLEAVCRLCKENGVHTAIDTAGCVPWASFQRLEGLADMYLYDIKALDGATHKLLTNADNALILQNLDRLIAAGKRIWVRVPCVPGANDAQMPLIAGWLRGKAVEKVELLPYHRLGGGKRAMLGLTGTDYDVPDDAMMEKYLQPFLDCGLPAVRG